MILVRNNNDRTILTYNLQFFAESPSGEKTEKPTPKKREKSREEGQVAKSIEITTAFMLIAMFLAIRSLIPYIYEKTLDVFHTIYSLFDIVNGGFTTLFAVDLATYAVKSLIVILYPFFLITIIIGLASNLLQVGWKPTLKALKPKFNKLNPIEGFKRTFSLRALMELIKSLLKMSIIAVIVYSTLNNKEMLILLIYNLPLLDGFELMADIAIEIGIKVGGFFIIVAAIDYAYQRYSHEKKLKMTKQEVKEEHKETEGNPEIKSKIRQKMREMSMRRMMQDLPDADVIITNPTHFAVAIKYDTQKSLAPKVLAKGVDFLATKIKSIALDNSIEIIENKPLARTLYYTVEIGDEIPQELYQSVAEILAFVYKLKNNTTKEGNEVWT